MATIDKAECCMLYIHSNHFFQLLPEIGLFPVYNMLLYTLRLIKVK